MPLPATSNLPTRRSAAPVKAPRSWPKSSLSRSSAGRAVQLIGTKGASLPGPLRWIAFAVSSFPVPLSPRIRTGVSLGVAVTAPMVL